jgi:hypothetical protein
MENNPLLPTFEEYKRLMCIPYYEEEDLIFQEKTALKVGFKTWEEYLEKIYDDALSFNTTILDISAKKLKDKESIPVGFTFDVQDEFQNTKFLDAPQMKAILLKFEKLSTKIKTRVNLFETKSQQQFLIALIKKNKDDDTLILTIKKSLTEFKGQRAVYSESSMNAIDNLLAIIESMEAPIVNAYIKDITNSNYYFPEKASKLQLLYDLLVHEKFIEPNEQFEKTFQKKFRPSNVTATLWCADSTKLYYLLYRLNDRDEYYHELSIEKIAIQLFRFKIAKSPKNARTNFTKALRNFNDSDYLEKKMTTVESILKKIMPE